MKAVKTLVRVFCSLTTGPRKKVKPMESPVTVFNYLVTQSRKKENPMDFLLVALFQYPVTQSRKKVNSIGILLKLFRLRVPQMRRTLKVYRIQLE